MKRGYRDRKRPRVCVPHVLRGRYYYPPRYEQRVLTGVQHLGQPVYGGVRVAPAHALYEGRYGVVVLVLLVDYGLFLYGLTGHLEGVPHHPVVVRARGKDPDLERVQRTPRVALRARDYEVPRIGGQLHLVPAQAVLPVHERPVYEHPQVGRGEGFELE